MIVPRGLARRFQELLEDFPVIVVVGARQVGKTTLVENLIGPTWSTVTFDPLQDVANARADPDLFLQNHPPPLFLDEIQYAPEIPSALKRLIDRQKAGKGKYVLSGSQRWEVMKSLSESMAGRAAILDLESFSLTEAVGAGDTGHWLSNWLESPEKVLKTRKKRLATNRTLYEWLWRGWLPKAGELKTGNVGIFHESYHRTYIERDIRSFGGVDDWHEFNRFARLIAALTAQELNFRQLGRDLGLAPQTAQRWLRMLVATCQWSEIPAYHGNTLKRVSGKPKGYLADTGQACFSLAIPSPQALSVHPRVGAVFETAIAGEIRKASSLLPQRPSLFHWRSHGGAEVDFILEYNDCMFPIEVKLKTHPTLKDLGGLKAFRETYRNLTIAPGLVIGPVESFHQLAEHEYAAPWDLAPFW